jgi:hypothetical protein
MSDELSQELTIHFKGLKRETALLVHSGQGKVQTGKDPM